MAPGYATDSSVFKTEPATHLIDGELPKIKPEVDSMAVSPSAHTDDELYEDAGDLDFAGTTQGIYLTRIPKYLWETWSKLNDDDEIRLGTIRIEGGSSDVKRMSLLLSSEAVQNRTVPKEYNMHITNRDSSNTFIFTEKDLPGYASKGKGDTRKGQSNGGFSTTQVTPRNFRDRSKIDKNKRWHPTFRKAIPKQTALAGQIQTEVNCLPVENGEYRHLMDQRTKNSMKPKRETKFLAEIIPGLGGNPGTLGPSGGFNTFIKNTGPARAKGQETKAARIPQNELLDLIYDCFKQYKYWPLKSLKAELNQPEAYLKQTLELVAHLVRQGTHAMTWELKPESLISAYAGVTLEQPKDEVAPDTGYDGASDYKEFGDAVPSDEDEDNVKMEDVLSI